MANSQRNILQTLIHRFLEPRQFIQVLYGPRQVGKTTLAHQLLNKINFKSIYASADTPSLEDTFWIQQQWDIARVHNAPNNNDILLVLDEI